MEPSEAEAPDVVDSAQRLLELLDSMSVDLADERPDMLDAIGDDTTDAGETDLTGGQSLSAHEDQAITRARSTIARSRSSELASRLEQARRHAQQVIDATRAERPDSGGPASGTSADPASKPASEDDAALLRATLAETARSLSCTRIASSTPEEMLHSIVAAALHAIPHVRDASITLLDRAGVITTHAPTSELVAAVDRVQVELREGPCIDALDEAHTDMTHAPDLATGPPWPTFAARALEAGFHEVLSFQLMADGAVGALNLYSDAPHRFDAQDELVGALLADQAAVALAGARRVGQLNHALETRDLIGRAKGILMERFGLADQQAFTMLVESSQHTNMKLVAVAQWLVDETEARHRRPVPQT